MTNNAAAFAERATSDTLTEPDWDLNIEICDIVNVDPRQATDAIEILKKRLGSISPKIQLLSLSALEALSKNCGENVFQEIVDRDVLHDMVEIVKEKSDLNVRKKILMLLDTWQEAFGGREGRYPQYYAAYEELKSSGVKFPPREKNSVPLSTPPQTHPIAAYGRFDLEASHQPDPSGLSSEIKTAQGIADVLMDMLNASDPNNRTGVEEELIAELVDQCCNYHNFAMAIIDSTSDEMVLGKALALNDTLIRALSHHDYIGRGARNHSFESGVRENLVVPLVNLTAEDDESRDDSGQLEPRSSRDSLHAHNKNGPHELVHVSPTLPRPPLATNPNCEDSSWVDYVSSEVCSSERHSSEPSLKNPIQTTFVDQPNRDIPSAFLNYSCGSSSYGLDDETRDLSLAPIKNE
ncbi:target of Myb protein 1 [Artemisia annua]|uniref:Target of Myb protein 1 n=1 Tax=Artemisia annua TaxID=35608 RepID=A0A2U1MNG3_ARTAN|nr:target of Myb protein 1 [Artemisia annua]